MRDIFIKTYMDTWETGNVHVFHIPFGDYTAQWGDGTRRSMTQNTALYPLFDQTFTILADDSTDRSRLITTGFTDVLLMSDVLDHKFYVTADKYIKFSASGRQRYMDLYGANLYASLGIGTSTSPGSGLVGLANNNTAFYQQNVQSINASFDFSPIGYYNGNPVASVLEKVVEWWTDVPIWTPVTDPYANMETPGDQPLPGGGSIPIPGLPPISATSTGIFSLFVPTDAQMRQLADFMWTDFGGTGTTVVDVLEEIVEAIKRAIANPLDYVFGLNIIPSQGLTIGASKTVRFGFVNSGVSMPVLANQFFTVDCGSLTFDPVLLDSFLDYAPYSKFSIYLPYIGFRDVDPNDFVGHTIGVTYHGDCVTGGITAYITKDGNTIYQFSGSCALSLPLAADSWGQTISAAVNVATAAFSAGKTAIAAAGGEVGKSIAGSAANVASNPSLLSPQVSHSGAVSGGAGHLGIQYPFVVREAVNFHDTTGFNKETGYPSYYYKEFSDVEGFTTILNPHILNIPQATQGEITEIENLLASGVIL